MRLSNVKLTALPGEKYQYSNANYIVLGALIEEITNDTYSHIWKTCFSIYEEYEMCGDK